MKNQHKISNFHGKNTQLLMNIQYDIHIFHGLIIVIEH